jgi:hypothetical protein
MQMRAMVLWVVLGLVGVMSPGLAAEADEHPPIPVTFTLKAPGFVTLVIDDAQGRRVRNLVADTRFEAGTHTLWWDGANDWGDMVEGVDGIYRATGALVAPGTYRVRGLVHGPIDLRYEFTPNSAGTPPWITADRTGNWTADHTPPCETLFLPGDTPQVLVGSAVAEAGDGLIYLNLDGHKAKGVRWISGHWAGAQWLARDRGAAPVLHVLAYAGAGWMDDATKSKGEIRLTALTDTANRDVLKYAVTTDRQKNKDAAQAARLAGLAVYNGVLVAGVGNTNELLVVRAKAPLLNKQGQPTGNMQQETLGTLPLPGVRALAFDRAGRLLALVGTRLLRYTLTLQPLGLSAPETLVGDGLDDPQRFTLDAQDAIYVSDWGKSHQVKLFTPEGRFIRAIGHPGAPAAGPYDPLHMNRPLGLTVDDRNRIWVAENDYLPKRVSVWTPDGALALSLVGPPDYGAGGEIDPQDNTRFYYADWHAGTMEFRLDWAKGTSDVARVLYRPMADDQRLGNANPQTPLYYQGRQYMTNIFNNSPTQLPLHAGLWLLRDGKAALVAAAGNAYYWDLLFDTRFAARWPEGIDLEKGRSN